MAELIPFGRNYSDWLTPLACRCLQGGDRVGGVSLLSISEYTGEIGDRLVDTRSDTTSCGSRNPLCGRYVVAVVGLQSKLWVDSGGRCRSSSWPADGIEMARNHVAQGKSVTRAALLLNAG